MEHRVLTFLAAAMILTLIPGNDTLLVMRNSLTHGTRYAFATTAGILSGLLVHGSFSALGLSVILMRSAILFGTVKFAGALFLIGLGLLSMVHAFRGSSTPIDPSGQGDKAPSLRVGYAQGIANNVFNPKVALFYMAFLPQFIAPGDPLFMPVLLAFMHLLLGVVQLTLVTLLAARLRSALSSLRARRWMDAIGGTVLVALGVKLAFAKR